MARFFSTMYVGMKMGVVGEDHRQRMGESIWLFMWLLGRQTGQLKNGTGIVNYGKPITFGVIHADTNFPIWTLRKWMYRLEHEKYIEREFQPNSEFVVRILNAKKYPLAKQVSTGNPQVGLPNTPTGGSQIWQGGQAKYGYGNARKRKKEYGFIGSLNKESPKVSTTVLRALPAILIGAKNMDKKPEEKDQEKAVAPSLDVVARSMSIPRADSPKSLAELDAERRRQLDELAAKDKIPRIKITQSKRTLEEQKAELKKRGFLP
jgi:hypothetical protein